MKKGNKKQQMFSWMNPKLEIKNIKKYGKEIRSKFINGKKIYQNTGKIGKGVFAKSKIKKGEIIMVMGGYILTIKDENSLRGYIADKPIEISESFSIGPRRPSDVALMPQHYINHSCDPNVGFKGQIFMVAMKDIKEGEEILYDYGMVMNPNKESNSHFNFKCLCGSKKCRGYISENDWKKTELQKRYDGYFQYFLQEKINKIKNKK